MSTTDRFSQVFDLPRQDIRLDPSRFQGRQGEYSEDTVNAIVSGGRFDPTVSSLVVWKDPDSGQYFLLSGHSRFEAAKRLYESGKQPGLTSLPVKELLNATEEEAVEYATIESNRRGTEEGLVSDLKAYALAVSSGKNSTQLKRLFRPDSRLRKLQELSYLNPKGMFVEYLAQPSQQSFPYLERNARWVGDMRRQLPALTNAHERELFDYLYGSKKALNLDKSKFYDLVNNKVNRIDFDPDKALNLNDRISPTAYTDPINEQLRELDRDIDVAQKEIETRRSAIARARGEGIEVPKYQGRQTFEERIAELNAHIIRLIEKKEALRQASGKLERTMGGDLFSQVEEPQAPKVKQVASGYEGIPLGTKITSTLRDYGQTYTLTEAEGYKWFLGDKDGEPFRDGGQILTEKQIMFAYGDELKADTQKVKTDYTPGDEVFFDSRDGKTYTVNFRGPTSDGKAVIVGSPADRIDQMEVLFSQLRPKTALVKHDTTSSKHPKVMLVTRQYGNPIYITANPEDEQFGFTGTDDENEAVTWDSTGSNYKELAEVLKRAKFVTGWDGLTFEAAYMHPDHGLHVVNTDMVSNMVEKQHTDPYKRALELGKEAFEKGLSRAPAQNKEIISMLGPDMVEDHAMNTKLMEEYIKGWDKANLGDIQEWLPESNKQTPAIKGITTITYEDDGKTLIYGTKNNRTRVSILGLSESDIKEELDFEKRSMLQNKDVFENLNAKENDVRNMRGLTLKEKDDVIKTLKSQAKQYLIQKDIIVPFYEQSQQKAPKENIIKLQNEAKQKLGINYWTQFVQEKTIDPENADSIRTALKRFDEGLRPGGQLRNDLQFEKDLGEPDPQPGNYYVTAIDGGHGTYFVLGPFEKHKDAIKNVFHVKRFAEDNWKKYNHWMKWGTARIDESVPFPLVSADTWNEQHPELPQPIPSFKVNVKNENQAMAALEKAGYSIQGVTGVATDQLEYHVAKDGKIHSYDSYVSAAKDLLDKSIPTRQPVGEIASLTVLEGHATPREIKHIKAFLESEFVSAKIGPRKHYRLMDSDSASNTYAIHISENVTDSSALEWNKDKTKLVNKKGVAQSHVKVRANMKKSDQMNRNDSALKATIQINKGDHIKYKDANFQAGHNTGIINSIPTHPQGYYVVKPDKPYSAHSKNIYPNDIIEVVRSASKVSDDKNQQDEYKKEREIKDWGKTTEATAIIKLAAAHGFSLESWDNSSKTLSFATRDNGDTGNETPGQEDLDARRKVMDLLRKEYSGIEVEATSSGTEWVEFDVTLREQVQKTEKANLAAPLPSEKAKVTDPKAGLLTTKAQFDDLYYAFSDFGRTPNDDALSFHAGYRVIQQSDNAFILNEGNDIYYVTLNISGGIDDATVTKNGRKITPNQNLEQAVQNHLQNVNPDSNKRNIDRFLSSQGLYDKTKDGHEFNYMMLSRLKMDCEYYLGAGQRADKHLHQLSVDAQIAKMKQIWNALPADGKPEWLSMQDILDYETAMKKEPDQMKNNDPDQHSRSAPALKARIRDYVFSHDNYNKVKDDAQFNAIVRESDLKKFQDLGIHGDLIMAFYCGVRSVLDFKGDYEMSELEGVFNMGDEYIQKHIDRALAICSSGMFEMGMKYPSFDWKKIVKKYGIRTKPEIIRHGRDKYENADDYLYEVFTGNDIAMGHSIGRDRYKGAKLTEEVRNGNEVKDLSKGFDGDYWGFVSSDQKVILDILKTCAAQPESYVKDIEVLVNGLGGIDAEVMKVKILRNPNISAETMAKAEKAVKAVKDLRDPKSPHIFKKGDRVEHVNPTDSWLKHKGVVTGTVIETGYAKIGQDKGWIKLVKVLFDDNSTVELEEEDFKAIDGKADTPRRYKLGDMWSADFDTDGMLRAAYNVPSMPRKDQELLYNSLSDNNYHSIAKTLWEAMAAFDNGDKDEAHRLLLETRAEAGDVIDDMNVEDACPPTRDGKPDITPAGLRGLQLCINHEGDTANRHKDHSGHYTAERMRVHQAIVDEFRNQKPCITAPKKPIAVLTGGAPGSGKSHFLKGFAPWLNGNKVLHIDADEVRAKLPEYKGWNADNTHTETSHIVNMMLDSIGTPCKRDLVYDGTMNKAKKYLPLVDRLKKMGYEVLVIYMQVPKDVSMARVMERYQRTGRYVPQHVIDEVYANGLEAYEEVIKAADGYIRVDGVTGKILEKGGKPIPSEREYDDEGCGDEPCNGVDKNKATPVLPKSLGLSAMKRFDYGEGKTSDVYYYVAKNTHSIERDSRTNPKPFGVYALSWYDGDTSITNTTPYSSHRTIEEADRQIIYQKQLWEGTEIKSPFRTFNGAKSNGLAESTAIIEANKRNKSKDDDGDYEWTVYTDPYNSGKYKIEGVLKNKSEPCCEGCAEKDGTPCEDTAKAKKIKLAKAFAFAAKARAKLLQLK